MKKIIAMLLVAVLVSVPLVSKASEDREAYIYGICQEVGAEYGISPELLQAIAYTESRYVRNAQNGDCKGICQVNISLHSERIQRLGISDPMDERAQITICADLLNELRQGKYGEDVAWTLDRYNGNSKADYYTQIGVLSDYSTKVLNKAQELTEEHDGDTVRTYG